MMASVKLEISQKYDYKLSNPQAEDVKIQGHLNADHRKTSGGGDLNGTHPPSSWEENLKEQDREEFSQGQTLPMQYNHVTSGKYENVWADKASREVRQSLSIPNLPVNPKDNRQAEK